MDQTSAQQALEPFLALAKSATSPRAAADLVTQATSAQGTYLFAELLAQKNIESLKNDAQYGTYHSLLEIFAWGTWETYQSTTGLPSLSDVQTLKLRLLSLVGYASEARSDLTYTTLCRRLGFDAPIDLEHLVTTAIYSNLIAATLNPAERIVLVTSVAPLRDLTPGSVQGMLEALQAWSQRCDSVIAGLDVEINKIKMDASRRAVQQAKVEKSFNAALEAGERRAARDGIVGGTSNVRGMRASNNKREAGFPTFDDAEDAMEIDAQPNGPRKKSGGLFDRLKPKS